MSLTIGGTRNIADARVQGVTLKKIVGSYTLTFGLYLTVHPMEEAPRSFEIIGARIFAKFGKGLEYDLGFARPEQHMAYEERVSGYSATPSLCLHLDPNQLSYLERVREDSDIRFRIHLAGSGVGKHGREGLNTDLSLSVAKSEWLQKLRDASARDTFFVEVSLPHTSGEEPIAQAASYLRRAEECFRNGDYAGCIGNCRLAIDEFGTVYFGENWSPHSPSEQRKRNRSPDDRMRSIWAAVREYTHLAHHGPSEGGLSHFSRADARTILSFTASLAAHRLDGF